MPNFYGPVDLTKNELRNAVVQNLGAAPSTPVKGQIYFDSTGNILYWYSGAAWVAAQGGAGAVPATTVTTQAIGDPGTVGVATTYAREDHKHGEPAFGTVTGQATYGAASANGAAATISRSDHLHGTVGLTTNAPSNQAIGDAATLGAGILPSKDDHKHGMPAFGGTVTGETTFGLASSVGAAVTLPRSDHTHGSPSLGTTPSTAAIGDAATGGVATTASANDHKHGMPAFGATVTETTFGSAPVGGSAATVPHSDHAHGNPTHVAADHSAIPLSALAVPTAPVNLNNQKLINVLDPTNPQEGATKNYVDNVAAGLSWKTAVRVASALGVNVAAITGLIAIDGVTVAAGDRVLLKDQTTTSQNGIYVAAAGAWARSTDADLATEILGMAVFVEEGTTNADTAWVCTTNAPITVGTTGLTFAQFAGGGTVTAGAGMTQSGNVLNVIAGDTSLTVAADSLIVNPAVMATVASLASYAPTTRTVTAGAGLTGGGDLSANRTLDVVAGDTSLTVAADSVVVNTGIIATVASVTAAVTGMAKKFAAALTGTASPEVVTHNLNTRDIQLTVLNGATPYTAVEVDWDATTVNTATIRYNPNLGAGYRCVVVG